MLSVVTRSDQPWWETVISHSQELPIRNQPGFILWIFGWAIWLSLGVGCMPMARTVATSGEMFLVNRTGKPVPGLPDYEVEDNYDIGSDSAVSHVGSQQMDNAITAGFAERARQEQIDSDSQNSGDITSSNAQQLLSEMLERSNDQFFRERLLELKKTAGSIPNRNLPRQQTDYPRQDQTAVVAHPAVYRSSESQRSDRDILRRSELARDQLNQAQMEQTTGEQIQDSSVRGARRTSRSSPQNSLSEFDNSYLPTNSLRDIQLPGNPKDMRSTHQVGANRQSMEIEVVSSDTPPAHETLARPQVSAETLALREQLKEANQLNRQMLAATAAMMPNALTAGAGNLGGGRMAGMNSNNLSSMLGATGINAASIGGGMSSGTMGIEGSLGGANHALLQMLQEKAATANQSSVTSYDSPSQIPAFDLSGNGPIGSAVDTSHVKMASGMTDSMDDTYLGLEQAATPGQWKGDLTETIHSLRAIIPQLTNNNERQTLEVYLRLLELISSNHDEAVRTIDSLPNQMQAFWRHQIFALSQITQQSENSDAMFVNHSRQATKTISHLRDAMGALQSVAMLQLSNLTFCEAVRSFGDYDLATTTTVSPGDPLLVYCEVENYATRKMSGTAGERYQTRLTPSYAIYNEQRAVVYQEDYPSVEDQCKSQRQDFFITLQLHVPQNLPPGRYDLVVSVDDIEGKKHTTGSPLPFHVR